MNPVGRLTDEIIAGASIPDGQKRAKLTDGHSLYLLLTDDGKRQWRVRLKGSDRVLGEYPAVGIAQAREAAQALRERLKVPSVETLAAAAPATVPAAVAQAVGRMPQFGEIAREWAEFDKAITAQALYRKRLYVHKKFTPLHALPLNQVTVEQCRSVYDAIRAKSAAKDNARRTGGSTAKRAGEYLSLIFQHAANTRGIIHNPAAGHKGWMGRSDRKALAKRRQKHTVDPNLFGQMMDAIDTWQPKETKEKGRGTSQTAQNFLRFVARIPLRASEITGARWAEFEHLEDPARAVWHVPGERMKQREPHDVPLSRQAVAILLEQRGYVAGHYPGGSEYVFPGRDSGRTHIDGDNQQRSLNALGFGHVHSVHGMRHAFETLAGKLRGPEAAFLAHLCTAHALTGVMARYVNTDMPEHRRELLQWWADEIERMKRDYTVAAA